MAEERKISLHEVFAGIPDPRAKQGRRHPLQAILSMTVAAMLSGCKGVDAIAQWGRVNLLPNRPLFRRFGFSSFTSPCPSTLHEVFSAIDVAAVERVLAEWVEALLPESQRAAWRRVSIDGKTLRGTLSKQEPEAPGVHLLSAFLQMPGCTLLQIPVDCKTNEPKAALELLAALVLENALVAGDAIFCQKELCAAITERKGDYFFVVKDNQPTLKAAIAEAFETPISPSEQKLWQAEVRRAREPRKHGSRLEQRELWATNRCNAFLNWPGVQQVCRIRRTVRQRQTLREESAYAITSLSFARAKPAQLLRIWREYWGIENRSHYVRDVTFGEDACRVRTGAAPQLLAALRNVIISYFHVRHTKNLAKAIRNLSWQAHKAAQIVGIQGVV